MVRPNRRKPIEEVYGAKNEPVHAGRSHAIPQPGMTKTAAMRCTSSRPVDTRTQRSYVTANDYYITTNLPLNATNMRTAPNNLMAHPSKTSQITPMMTQSSAIQTMPYGSLSNRRVGKASARQPIPIQQQQQHQQQQQQQKVHFAGKGHHHMHPHAHNSLHGNQSVKQMSQRNSFVQPIDIDPTLVELSEKDMMSTSNLRRSHPLQHQLHQQQQQMHQQQQQMHPLNNSPVVHHSHQHQKHQQHQQIEQHQSRQQHPRQRGGHSQPQEIPLVTEEEDKEEDPEEFFELIRQTVKTAVGTTFCDVVSRNFRDLASKIDRFSNELKLTNENLGKLHNEVMNKVMQYGEENTRHFRYLCMKSEYDKMFYQHQTLIAGKQPTTKMSSTMPVPTKVAKQSAVFNQKSVKQQLAPGKLAQGDNTKKVPKESVKSQNPFGFQSNTKTAVQQQQVLQQKNDKQLSPQQSNSSDMGVREVLGQIQRFCTQMQLNDLKDEQPKYNSLTRLHQMDLNNIHASGSNMMPNNAADNDAKLKSRISAANIVDEAELETTIDSMDEIEIDNFQYSSDEMSSYTDDSGEIKFSGGMTARAPINSSRPKLTTQLSHKGAGDGQ